MVVFSTDRRTDNALKHNQKPSNLALRRMYSMSSGLLPSSTAIQAVTRLSQSKQCSAKLSAALANSFGRLQVVKATATCAIKTVAVPVAVDYN